MEAIQDNLFADLKVETKPKHKEGTLMWAVDLMTNFATKSFEEEGLYTGSAAARVLGVSPQMVSTLGKRKLLTVFCFDHGTFYSGKELKERLLSEKKKGGRPRLLDSADLNW